MADTRTDAELAAALLEAVEGKTGREAAELTGLSNGTIADLRKGTGKAMRKPTRKAIEAFLDSRGNNGEAAAENGTRLEQLPVAAVKPWPGLNPRTHFDETELEGLAQSFRTQGIRSPIGVHLPAGDTWSDALIVFGERRWRAAQRAGLETIPCLVREYTYAEALEIAIIENLQREDLSPIEEAKGFKRWLDAEPGRTQGQLAERVGKSQPVIANRLRLLDLPETMHALMEEDVLPMRLARDIVLPFAKLDELARSTFFEALAVELRKVKDTPIAIPALLDAIREAGYPLSRPLDANTRHWSFDNEPLLFEAAKLHGECGCNAPAFKWHGYAEPAVRCFGVRWWDGKQAAARLLERKQEEERQAELKLAGDAAGGKLPSVEQLREKHGWHTVVPLTGKEASGSLSKLLHPEEISAEAVTVASEDRGKGLALVCREPEVIKRAEARAKKEQDALLAKRKQERDEADLAAIEGKPFRLGGVVTLITGNRIDSYRLKDAISACAKALGIPQTSKAKDDQLQRLFTLLEHRISRGDYRQYGDPLESQVRQELREAYAPKFAELLAAKIGGGEQAPPAADPEPATAADTGPSAEELLRLRFAHLHEGILQVDVAHREELGAEAVVAARTTLERRVESLRAHLVEIGAVCIAEWTGEGVCYSVADAGILESAEALIAEERALASLPDSVVEAVEGIEEVLVGAHVAALDEAATAADLEGEDALHFGGLSALPVDDVNFASHLRVAKPKVLRAVRDALQAQDLPRHRGRINRIEKALRKRGAPVDEEVLAHA